MAYLNSIYLSRMASDIVIDCKYPIIKYIKIVYKYYGNTPEAREIIARIKILYKEHIEEIRRIPLNNIRYYLNKCGMDKKDIISVFRKDFRRLYMLKEYYHIHRPHLRRYLIELKQIQS